MPKQKNRAERQEAHKAFEMRAKANQATDERPALDPFVVLSALKNAADANRISELVGLTGISPSRLNKLVYSDKAHWKPGELETIDVALKALPPVAPAQEQEEETPSHPNGAGTHFVAAVSGSKFVSRRKEFMDEELETRAQILALGERYDHLETQHDI